MPTIAELHVRIEQLEHERRGEIEALHGAMRSEINDLRHEMRGETDGLRNEIDGLRAEMTRMEERLEHRLIIRLGAMMAAGIGVVAVLVGRFDLKPVPVRLLGIVTGTGV